MMQYLLALYPGSSSTEKRGEGYEAGISLVSTVVSEGQLGQVY